MAKISDSVRTAFMDKFREYFEGCGETVLLIKSNGFSIPWAADGEEGYINVTFTIPKGSRDGTPFDGFNEAENYKFETAAKAAAKAERDAKKKKKIERDKAARKTENSD